MYYYIYAGDFSSDGSAKTLSSDSVPPSTPEAPVAGTATSTSLSFQWQLSDLNGETFVGSTLQIAFSADATKQWQTVYQGTALTFTATGKTLI